MKINRKYKKVEKKSIYIILLLLFVLLIVIGISLLNSTYSHQGCCSYHGGQNYCDKDTGWWVCNDENYSPTCRCGEYDDNTVVSSDDSYDDFNYYYSDDKPKYNEDDFKDFNSLIAVVILIVFYFLFRFVPENPKHKINNTIVKKFINVIFTIYSISLLWIIIPIILGMKGHFLLEIIFIILSYFLVSYNFDDK